MDLTDMGSVSSPRCIKMTYSKSLVLMLKVLDKNCTELNMIISMQSCCDCKKVLGTKTN